MFSRTTLHVISVADVRVTPSVCPTAQASAWHDLLQFLRRSFRNLLRRCAQAGHPVEAAAEPVQPARHDLAGPRRHRVAVAGRPRGDRHCHAVRFPVFRPHPISCLPNLAPAPHSSIKTSITPCPWRVTCLHLALKTSPRTHLHPHLCPRAHLCQHTFVPFQEASGRSYAATRAHSAGVRRSVNGSGCVRLQPARCAAVPAGVSPLQHWCFDLSLAQDGTMDDRIKEPATTNAKQGPF